MKYEIIGKPFSVVECELDDGESMQCESGAMCWMSSNMQMETSAGGFGKAIGRLFSGEKLFRNIYTANGEGKIAFGSSFAGNIVAVEVGNGQEVICQKSAFLAATRGVESSVFFQKKLGAGFFGGEGFIMQRLSGNGTVFLEIDGSPVTKELAPGEKIVVATGYVAIIDSSCSLDIQSVKGIKNMLFGGESLFNTVITGPGKVTLQTMPISQLASSLIPYLPTPSSSSSND
ncbi:MAG: TIGR00266 family protein [Lachnospiraceae bacterium]|nr:TIGR00266 family protein [Lachnospiraceae bacterium]